jgi:heat-inducible transcriptional repressor
MKMLDTRHKKILRAIIQSHIDLNAPVGSLLITKRYPIGLSSASVRNTMSSLEKLGYIAQPHTSAGRIPTEKGYRFYVEYLMEEETLSVNASLSKELSDRLKTRKTDNSILLKEAARTLSTFSCYPVIAIPPRVNNLALRRIKFIKYEKNRVLAILISDERIIKNKIIELDKAYTQRELDSASDYLNNKFAGLTINRVKEQISYQLHREEKKYNRLLADILLLFREILMIEAENSEINELSGTSFLPDFASMKQIKAILKAIEDKQFLLKLLNQISDHEGTQVFVGTDNILPAMKELSLVVSTYSNRKNVNGAIGIIGPTRMNYKKLIPVVDHTAKALTRILSGS